MPALSKALSLSRTCKENCKLTIALFVLLGIFLFGRAVEAQYVSDNDTKVSAETNTYVFLPEQSTVVQTGGFAGVHETYAIEGQFRLTVDFDAGTALFGQVDANLVDESPFLPTESLGELFNMAELLGTVVDDTIIDFVGKTADGMEKYILLTLTFRDDSAHLTGRIVPPPDSADFFTYKLDAIALKKYGGGTGELNNPYLIYTAEQMNAIGAEPNDWDKHFKLMADIDLDPNLPGRKVFNKAVIAPETNAAEWDFQGTAFSGSFAGNDHQISNLTVTGEDYLGLFGLIDSQAKISNLGIMDVNVISAGEYGRYAQNIGGLVGANYGNVVNCYSTGNITGDSDVGGLVGYNRGSLIQCYSSGMITSGDKVGGLVGINTGNMINCYSTGAAIGNEAIGGLVGMNGMQGGQPYPGYIDNSYSLASVRGEIFVGGLVGDNRVGDVMKCYSKGIVTGNEYVGGLIGQSYFGSIANSYSTGEVSGGGNYVGGLVGGGWKSDTTASFWDIETSGLTNSDGGTGKTTAEMQTARTFLDAGWDFVDESVNGIEDIWSICEGTNYPRLAWQIPAGDFVCPDGITIEDFVFFIEHWRDDNCDLSNDYCQGTDLDFSGTVDEADLEIFLENWLTDVRSD